MADTKTITITLDASAAEALEASVTAGHHPSVEAAASSVIDEWWADRAMDLIGVEQIRRMVQAGADSGPSVDGEEVFARLIAKYQALAKARGAPTSMIRRVTA